NSEMIAKVDGVMNGISVIGDKVGETMYYGPGAGGDATASAVVANIIDIARGKGAPMLGFKKPLESGLTLASIDSIESKYYLRMKVEDRSGVLAKIATVLSQDSISIASMLQKPLNDDTATLLLSTHICTEKQIQNAIKTIEGLDFILSKPSMIRIEE
ncbi:MAG: ACT domain-containing protein, partial [Campylobacterota bacterium]|nr:ACT domain-containing protein [Campylobacterota bacterium]